MEDLFVVVYKKSIIIGNVDFGKKMLFKIFIVVLMVFWKHVLNNCSIFSTYMHSFIHQTFILPCMYSPLQKTLFQSSPSSRTGLQDLLDSIERVYYVLLIYL